MAFQQQGCYDGLGMMPIKRMEFKEEGPELEFGLALSVAHNRFGEAVALNTPSLRFFTTGDHPQTLRPMATYLLVEDYELMTLGRGERFAVSLPIIEKDPVSPVLSNEKDDAYFIIGQPGDFEHRQVVNAKNYDALFGHTDRPLVEDLLGKLNTFMVAPIRLVPGLA